MRTVKVSCPFCRNANQVDLEMYGVGQNEKKQELLDLYDICDYCGATYAFDVELNYIATAYDPRLAN